MPADGTAAGPVAIVAGSGRLPILLADSLARRGRACRILALRGFGSRDTRQRASATVDLVDVKGALATLTGWRPSAVALVGGVARPGPAALLGALSMLKSRDEIAHLVGRGDDQLLRSVVSLLEENGLVVAGLGDLAPELLAPAGVIGRHAPSPADHRAIAVAQEVLADLARHDVGQAVVVCGERVVAIEGPEGTDRTLARVRGFRRFWSHVRIGAGGVLVKAPKRGQDLRVDLPAIGPRTIAEAKRAGLSGIALASAASLILEREEAVAVADRLGLFLFGLPSARS